MTGGRDARWAVVLTVVVLLAACGSAGAGPAASASSPSPTGSTRIAPTTPGAGPTPAPPARVVTARDQDNGRALSIHVGDQLLLALDAIWQPLGSSDPAVLRPAGQLGITPRYDALAPGRAEVTARRVSCGEAPSCTDESNVYRLTVIVLG